MNIWKMYAIALPIGIGLSVLSIVLNIDGFFVGIACGIIGFILARYILVIRGT